MRNDIELPLMSIWIFLSINLIPIYYQPYFMFRQISIPKMKHLEELLLVVLKDYNPAFKAQYILYFLNG